MHKNIGLINWTTTEKTYPIIFGIGDIFCGDLWPEMLAYNYQLHDEDFKFIYKLRRLDISGSERKKRINNYKITTFPFRIAANAIAWMEPSNGPSKEFVEWTKKKRNDLKIDISEVTPDQIIEKPFNVYENTQ